VSALQAGRQEKVGREGGGRGCAWMCTSGFVLFCRLSSRLVAKQVWHSKGPVFLAAPGGSAKRHRPACWAIQGFCVFEPIFLEHIIRAQHLTALTYN
jgi:hypothetical protein